jgi:peptide/nickel transport system permease protein
MADGDGLPSTGRLIRGGSAGEAELPVVGAVAWPTARARSESPLAEGVRRLRKNKIALAGAGIVAVLVLTAIFADVLATQSPTAADQTQTFQRPSWEHPLGTDQLGRDLLTRLIYGARISLYVGFGAVALGSLLATALGVLSAYFGGRLDLWLQRAVDAWMAFPPLLLLMSIMSLLGPSALNITLVLGVAFGIQSSRIIRGVALSVKEHTFVESARALGSGHVRITAGHILPNVLPTIIVVATTGLSTVILTEASLSFLGLGVPPPYPTWGGMLSLAGLDHMYQAPWLAIWPAVALSLAVFGFNMLGDALRDLLDPRLKGG